MMNFFDPLIPNNYRPEPDVVALFDPAFAATLIPLPAEFMGQQRITITGNATIVSVMRTGETFYYDGLAWLTEKEYRRRLSWLRLMEVYE